MLYHLSYPGLIDGKGQNFSLESNAMQGVMVCDTMSSFDRQTNFVFIYFFDVLNQIDKWIQT